MQNNNEDELKFILEVDNERFQETKEKLYEIAKAAELSLSNKLSNPCAQNIQNALEIILKFIYKEYVIKNSRDNSKDLSLSLLIKDKTIRDILKNNTNGIMELIRHINNLGNIVKHNVEKNAEYDETRAAYYAIIPVLKRLCEFISYPKNKKIPETLKEEKKETFKGRLNIEKRINNKTGDEYLKVVIDDSNCSINDGHTQYVWRFLRTRKDREFHISTQKNNYLFLKDKQYGRKVVVEVSRPGFMDGQISNADNPFIITRTDNKEIDEQHNQKSDRNQSKEKQESVIIKKAEEKATLNTDEHKDLLDKDVERDHLESHLNDIENPIKHEIENNLDTVSFDIPTDRVRYFIADRNKHYCTNAYEYLDSKSFLVRYLIEQGFKKVFYDINEAKAEYLPNIALVVPVESVMSADWYTSELFRDLQQILGKESANVIVITADKKEDLHLLFNEGIRDKYALIDDDYKTVLESDSYTVSNRYEVFLDMIIKNNRAVISDEKLHVDEVANYFFMKMITEPEKYEKLMYSKIYSLAQYIVDNNGLMQDNLNNSTGDEIHIESLEDLERIMKDDVKRNKVISLSQRLNFTVINENKEYKPTDIERISWSEVGYKVKEDIAFLFNTSNKRYQYLDKELQKNKKRRRIKMYKLISRNVLERWGDPYSEEDIKQEDFSLKCLKAVVRITNNLGDSSAFVITPDGYAITCAHSVANKEDLGDIANKELRCFVKDDMDPRKEWEYKYTVINVKADLDMALIKIDVDKRINYLKIADEKRKIHLNEECYLYGYPYGSATIKTSIGIISSLAEKGGDGELGNIYYFDGNAYAGDSGGPIIAKNDGCVIGILRGAKGPIEGLKINYMKPISYFWKEFLLNE